MLRSLATAVAIALLARRRLGAFASRPQSAPAPPPPAPRRLTLRAFLLSAAILAGMAALAGSFTVLLGLVPIKASSGHWAITKWLLNFSMGQSVATHSVRIEPPPLDDPALVLRGAGAYEGGCRPCHGGPGSSVPLIAAAMTPEPPDLRTHVPSWTPAQLFYIVKHGVKFTGMPAWPSPQRDDEVWAMVAFLGRLPALTPEEYDRLVSGRDAESEPIDLAATSASRAPPEVVATCARCHGRDGAGRGNAFPRLAGQRREYLRNALAAFAEGRRHSGIMGPIAAALDVDRMNALAEHYAGVVAPPSRDRRDGDLALGERISRHGIPGQRVPSCRDCHGPGSGPRNPAYPRLAGQHRDYLALQLRLFREGTRGGSAYAHLMQEVAPRLTPEQAGAVAAYYASLAPGAATETDAAVQTW